MSLAPPPVRKIPEGKFPPVTLGAAVWLARHVRFPHLAPNLSDG